MRPIDVEWNTIEMVTREFSPRKLLYRRVLRTIVWAMLIQAIITPVFVGLLRSQVLARFDVELPAIPGVPVGMDIVVAAGLGFLLMLGLTLPMLFALVREQTQSMSNLLQAIRRIAEGGQPTPLPVRDNGEMGYLMTAFNDMASRLIASRQAILDANARLEKRVADRTRQLEQAAKKLDHMASTDILTGLANRRAWNIEMEHRFAQALQNEQELICIAIDLDSFKSVNDTLGHNVGDSVLKAASQAIISNLRGDDFSARLGGDEFVILLSLDKTNIAESITKRIQAKFQAACKQFISDSKLKSEPSMSFGMATRISTSAQSAEELLNFADHALYAAKSAGKGCLQLYSPPSAAA